MQQPIVVTGMGIISAIGRNRHETLASLLDQQSGIGTVRYLKTTHTELPIGEVKMSNDEMKRALDIPTQQEVSRTALLGMMAVKEALADAGIAKQANGTDDAIPRRRVVLISGTTVGGMDITEAHFAEMRDSGKAHPCLLHHDGGACTKDMAEHFGLFTDYTTLSTACSSAANAILLGADMLRAGDADVVVCGGTEALSRFHLNGFNALMILDHQPCRPFDNTRAGLNLGEGAGYVVLQREDDARNEHLEIKAWLSGYTNTCDAYHQTASSPQDTGAQLAMRKAMDMAGIDATDIQWIHAHGTGTPNNDASESEALKAVFGDELPLVSSTKGYTGHTTSAAGGLSAVMAVMALRHGFVPGNVGFSQAMDGGITPLDHTLRTAVHGVLVNAFGFGGNDTALLFTDHPTEMRHETLLSDDDIVVAAHMENSGVEALKDLRQFVRPMETRRMGKLMKSTMLTSLQALKQAGIDQPDAIITATAWGCLDGSEQLLQQLTEGEESLSPTLFMQSTHNTLGSTVAIHLHDHGFNTTFTQGDRSLYWARYQARLLLRLGRCRSVLVGSHDESTPLFASLMQQLGIKTEPDVHSVAEVLTLAHQPSYTS